MIWIANGAVRYSELGKQQIADGQRTALLTVVPTDIDLTADQLIQLGEAMVIDGQEILAAEAKERETT